jgi:hypothetical protein
MVSCRRSISGMDAARDDGSLRSPKRLSLTSTDKWSIHIRTAQAYRRPLCLYATRSPLRILLAWCRCLWMDIPQAVAFGHDLYAPRSVPLPEVKGRGPTVTFRYTTELRAYLNKHDLFSRVQAAAQITVPPPPHKLLNGNTWILCTTRMLTARCRKLRMGEIPWSPQYQLIRAKLHAWNLLRA